MFGKIQNVEIDSQNPNFVTENAAIYTKDRTKIIAFVNNEATSFKIPEGVTEIKVCAFSCREKLTNIRGVTTSNINSSQGKSYAEIGLQDAEDKYSQLFISFADGKEPEVYEDSRTGDHYGVEIYVTIKLGNGSQDECKDNTAFKVKPQDNRTAQEILKEHISNPTNPSENKITNVDKILVFIPFILIYVVIWLGWC